MFYTKLYLLFIICDKNKDCKCGNNSKNVYLKEWLIFIILFDIYLMMFFIISNSNCYDHYITDYLSFYMSLLTIISLIIFIYKVVKE